MRVADGLPKSRPQMNSKWLTSWADRLQRMNRAKRLVTRPASGVNLLLILSLPILASISTLTEKANTDAI